jgi:hypothetical protein
MLICIGSAALALASGVTELAATAPAPAAAVFRKFRRDSRVSLNAVSLA